MKKKSDYREYAVYATPWVKNDVKKIKLLQFLMIDSQGKLVGEGEGDMTIGFYEGRSSLRKIKEAVRSFAHYELEQLKLKGNVPLENIELKDSVEMERILSKVRSERYEHLKGLR